MEATTQYFGKLVFYKQVLEFHCPSKFLCQTSGRQNHWSLLYSVLLLSTEHTDIKHIFMCAL